MDKTKFKFLEHTADIKFQAFGKNLNKCFENSALAMINSQYKGKVKGKIKKKVKVKGKDLESLLYNFLEEILFLVDTEKFLASKVKVKIKNKELESELTGDNIKNYKLSWEIKAITYNEMFVKKIKNKFKAQVVLDV